MTRTREPERRCWLSRGFANVFQVRVRRLRELFKSILRGLLRLPRGCPVAFGVWWRLGQAVGINSHVPWPVHFTSVVRAPRKVRIGRETFPGDSPNCYIQATNGVVIGDYTNLGPGVGLISANHDPLDNRRFLPAPPIRLGRNCWLGMNAIILPGVVLGDHTIVGAGAVVTKSFEDGYCVLVGNPAHVVRKVDPKAVALRD